MKKQIKKLSIAVCLCVAVLAVALSGCGGVKSQEEMIAEMKEFAVPDGSASIYLRSDWEVQDMGLEASGVDFWLGAASKAGDKIMIFMQFPRNNVLLNVSTMDEIKAMVNENYGFTADGNTYETPAVPGMTNVEVAVGNVNVESVKGQAYIVYGETDYALYAILFAANKMNDSEIAYAQASCSKFVENAPEEEDNTTAEVTDTIRWFNASYAVLTDLNGWDYNRFGGLAANEESMQIEQELLESWWSVTDRASADETLDWILTEGHRKGFGEEMSYLQENGMSDVAEDGRADFVLQYYNVDADGAQWMANAYSYFEQYGATAIDGWDYCRAMNLLGYYYIAGYYTEQEALDKSLEIALMIQPLFESWDELVESYLRGYEYWSEESADERRAVYQDLLTRSDNPYTVDYKASLEKTW